MVCSQPCRRLCARGHPCNKQCAEPCGNCRFPVHDVKLPCGHDKASVPWCAWFFHQDSLLIVSQSHGGQTRRGPLRRNGYKGFAELRALRADVLQNRSCQPPLQCLMRWHHEMLWQDLQLAMLRLPTEKWNRRKSCSSADKGKSCRASVSANVILRAQVSESVLRGPPMHKYLQASLSARMHT